MRTHGTGEMEKWNGKWKIFDIYQRIFLDLKIVLLFLKCYYFFTTLVLHLSLLFFLSPYNRIHDSFFSFMKKILVAPRFFELGKTYRAFATNSIGEYLFQQNIAPILPFYSTELSSYEEAKECILKIFDTYELDGIVLQGGNDISSTLYGEEEKNVQGAQIFRDYFELALMHFAIEKNIPVFGICRGMQMMNVALGGTLHQHLHEEDWHVHVRSTTGSFLEKDIEQVEHTFHMIALKEDGVLRTIFSDMELHVNSYHHQGIKTVGKDLFVEAVGMDGLVEAVSMKEKGILGVQWHPELDWSNSEFAAPFLWWLREYIRK